MSNEDAENERTEAASAASVEPPAESAASVEPPAESPTLAEPPDIADPPDIEPAAPSEPPALAESPALTGEPSAAELPASVPFPAAFPPPEPGSAVPPVDWSQAPASSPFPPTMTNPAYPPAGYGPSPRSRRRIVLFTGIAAAAVVLVVALVTANSNSSPAGQTSQQAAPAEPTTTTQPPESAADYQQALTGLATALNNGLTELNNAQTPAAISTAVTDLSNGLQQAESALGAVPPTDATSANDALVAALQGLTGSDLSSISTAATSDQVCLGPAATALLSRTPSLDQLRQAITALTSGGLTYQFGAALPAVTQDGERTAGNGSIVAGGGTHGLGELTMTNGGDTDATLALVAGQGAPLVTVYIGHGATYTLHHIPDGNYTVYVTSGDDWDSGARLFSRNCQFQQFDQTMDFTTTSREYTTYTITLTPVAGGTASLSDVDPGAFPH